MHLLWIIAIIHLFILKTSSVNNTSCRFFRIRYGSEENSAVCQGEFLQIDDLKEALLNITENINTFEFERVSIDALPEDMFGGMENVAIKKIIFTQASVELLSIPQNIYSPFKSVEDSLENLEIYDSSSVFAWNISILTSLKKLTTFIMENSDLFEVKEIFQKFTTLKFIQFVNSNIKWLHIKAFKNNKNLTICSLANNHISHVQRSIFPKPAMHLWSLDLSFNKIKSLPDDMFEEMPFLHELKLDNNHLKRFQLHVVSSIWNRLTQLWLDGNDAICWPFCWTVGKQHRPLFLDSSKCTFAMSSELILDSFYPFCTKSRKHLQRL